MTKPPSEDERLPDERVEWRDSPARPPRWQLPGIVALERVLVRNERVAVALVRASVYRTGIELETLTVIHGDRDSTRA